MLTYRNRCQMYEVEGAGEIKVAWRELQPSVRNTLMERTIIFIPGWGYNEHAEAITPLCQAYADYSRGTTYAIDTRAERIVPHTLLYEAEAPRRFIQEKCIKNVVIVAHSFAGGLAGE